VEHTSIFKQFIFKRDLNKPYYIQLADFIKEKILDNEIEQLPSERSLSSLLNVSRTTVIKAYEMLKLENIIKSVRGSGYYINKNSYHFIKSRKDRAIYLINNLIDKLLDENYSFNDIRNLFNLILSYKEDNQNSFNIAFIDCNPETYLIVFNQLKNLFKINLNFYLNSCDFLSSNINKIIENYDLILTTKTHYNEIIKILKNLEYEDNFTTNKNIRNDDDDDDSKNDENARKIINNKNKSNMTQIDEILIKVNLELDNRTILNLGKIKKEDRKIVITYSKRFSEIIKSYLIDFDLFENCNFLIIEDLINKRENNEKFIFNDTNDTNITGITKLDDFDWIILPENYKLFSHSKYFNDFFIVYKDEFVDRIILKLDELIRNKNIGVIYFDYKIDKGSLIFIEDKISKINSIKLKEFIYEGDINEKN